MSDATGGTARLVEALRRCLDEHRVRRSKLLVAVSGGSDSVALLHLLAGQRRDLELGLHVAHLDHMLRGAESAGDAEFVRDLADGLGLPATVAARDVDGWKRAHGGGSLEAAARAVRLDFLEEVAARVGAEWIVLGHTADDQAETVLLNLVRGTGLAGLRGMRAVRDRFLRPLLTARRADLRRMLEDAGLAYRSDSSNLSLEHRRNRMRAAVLPLLEERFNARAVANIARSAAILGRLDAWLAEVCGDLLRQATVASAGDRIAIELPPLRGAPEPIRERAIKQAVERILGQAGELTAEHLEDLCRLVERHGPGRLQLPGGLVAVVTAELLEIGPAAAAQDPGEWQLEATIPGELAPPGVGKRLFLEILDRPEGFASDLETEPHESYMDFERLGRPATIRNRRAGDRFHALGAPGSRKLKEFFIDEKVPAGERASVPLLVDERGIACVLGYRISDRMRVTRRTRRLLHVRLEEAGGPDTSDGRGESAWGGSRDRSVGR